ncbi:M1 family aminopeptidase [Sunxiuqinia sp. A32]|uniref:M1 family aminopeptidase n=1 Tax=Sunxiuqinia sp. A32 TaxID=3461496 RepID=UPI004046637C
MGSRYFYIISFFLLVPVFVQAQQENFDFEEQKAAREAETWLKLATFKESENYGDYDLFYQRMEWEVDPAVHFIKGEVVSYYKPTIDGFNTISFDLADNMQVDSVYHWNKKVDFQHTNDRINISFANETPIGITDSLIVWYQGVPNNTDGSFVTATTDEGDPVLWTLSEPYGAMQWWPCKQSLVDKIDSIDVIVTCPAGNKVASNGKLVSQVASVGKTTVHWKHNHPIATYLVAIGVSNYEEYTDILELQDGRQIEILNYVYPADLENWRATSSYVLDIMELFNEIIGEYPFADEKYGHAQFGWGGGMEHQTMSFMVNLGFALVAHEMAHQWFGDCLTLNSWHDIWLNEGFATYMTGLTFENLLSEGEWLGWKNYRINQITGRPDGSVYVDDTTSVRRIFDSRLSYSKGGYLLHMLRWELGDEVFFQGLQEYFNDPGVKYGFASQQSFVNQMETAGDTTLTEFFNDWYYGEGYPEYHIVHYRSYASNGKYFLKINQDTSDPSVDFFEMHVPLRVWKDGASKDLRLHNISSEQEFELEEEPDSIEFDPDRWLISKNSTVISGAPVYEDAEITIYPNPVTNELYISLDQSEKIQSVAISDVNGKIIEQFKELPSNKINVSQLASGTYFLQLETDKKGYRKQFLKVN